MKNKIRKSLLTVLLTTAIGAASAGVAMADGTSTTSAYPYTASDCASNGASNVQGWTGANMAQHDEDVAYWLDQHNADRVAAGENALTESASLDQVANCYAAQMAHNSETQGAGAMVHSTNDATYGFNVKAPGGWSQIAENIARSSTTMGTNAETAIMQAWLASTPHHDTIYTGIYDYVGFGVAYDNSGQTWVDVIFGDYPSSPDAPATTTPASTPADTGDHTGVDTSYTVDGNGNQVTTPVTDPVTSPVTAPVTEPVTTPVAPSGGSSTGGGGGAAPVAPTPSPTKAPTTTPTTPVVVAGETRYSTATAFAARVAASPAQIVLVSGEAAHMVDSVSAAPYAKAVGAPLLLTTGSALSPEVASYLDSTPSVHGVTIIGGQASVSDAVASELKARGLAVMRINGDNRYETSAAVAAQPVLAKSSTVLIASGGSVLADSVSASGAAAGLGIPVLVVPNSSSTPLDGWTRAAVQGKTVITVGGTSSVPEAVASALNSSQRLSGADRYATALSVASWAASKGEDTSKVVIAPGSNDHLADALVAGAMGVPTLLVPAQGWGADVTSFVSTNKSAVTVVGGSTPLS